MISKRTTIKNIEVLADSLSRIVAEDISIEFNSDIVSFEKGDKISINVSKNPSEENAPKCKYAMIGYVISNKDIQENESGLLLSFGGILSRLNIPYEERADFSELEEVSLTIST